jgi:Spy/CpxP family protein refolding chaperone
MLNSLRSFCLATLAVVMLVANLSAQETKRPMRGQGGPGGMRSPTQLPDSLGLSDEQKAKVADIEKKYADKVKAVGEKAKLTEEQQGKMRDVFTKFRESGKDRSEMQAFIAEELKLTPEQKKAREEQTALFAEITKEVEAVLTAEQKTKLAELRSARGGRPGAGAAPGKRPERKKND